jgi:hypothetical protein
MKLNPDIALLIMLIVFGVILGVILLALVWYYLAFIVELAAKCGWGVLILGAGILTFCAIEILAGHNK